MIDSSPRLALVTTAEAVPLDPDLPLLLRSFQASGALVEMVSWEDPEARWEQFDLALIRSPWNYTWRYPAFMEWVRHTASATRLHNPAEVLGWNTDKHYLAALAAGGVRVVPTKYLEPGQEPSLPPGGEVVVKPAISAGAKNTARYQLDQRAEREAALEHAAGLLRAGKTVMVQPFLRAVEDRGETALIYIDGRFSHAVRKGPLLRPHQRPVDGLFAPEDIRPHHPSAEELSAGAEVLTALAGIPRLAPHLPLLYARVDLVPDAHGAPALLELEVAEPSLFLDQAAAERVVQATLSRLG